MYRNGLRILQVGLRQFRLSACSYAERANQKKTQAQAKSAPSEKAVAKLKKQLDSDINEYSINARFLERMVGGSYHNWLAVLEKHPELRSIKGKDIINSIEKLKSLKYVAEDILNKPMVLCMNALTLENRYNVLIECGFSKISLTVLFKYVTIMNKTPILLKTFNYIPKDLNVVEQLRRTFSDIEVQLTRETELNELLNLRLLRERILTCYLRQRLELTDSNLEKLWRVYGRVRHKRFRSVVDMIALLEQIKFSKQRITKNAFLLYADPDNVRRIISEVKPINGQDIREILYKQPKIMMSPCDSLLKTLQYVKAFGIGEEAVIRCLEVLTLGPETVLERLRDLNEIEEFKVLVTNPRVLRLVHYQNKARLRLEYLNQLKVRCASLHILSCGSEAFAKFARDGSDRTKGCDVVVYLSNVLQRDDQIVRNLLSRHPNWCHIPVVHVKQCYEFLRNKKFDNDNIFRNIHLLLYPM